MSPADAPKSIAVPPVPTMMPALVRLQGPAPPAVTPVAPEMIPELMSAPDPFVAPYYAFLAERTPKGADESEPRAWRKDEYPT